LFEYQLISISTYWYSYRFIDININLSIPTYWY